MTTKIVSRPAREEAIGNEEIRPGDLIDGRRIGQPQYDRIRSWRHATTVGLATRYLRVDRRDWRCCLRRLDRAVARVCHAAAQYGLHVVTADGIGHAPRVWAGIGETITASLWLVRDHAIQAWITMRGPWDGSIEWQQCRIDVPLDGAWHRDRYATRLVTMALRQSSAGLGLATHARQKA